MVVERETNIEIGTTLYLIPTYRASTTRRLAMTSLLAVMLVGCSRSEDRGRLVQPLATASSSSAASPLGTGTAYTADERGGALSRVDLATGRVTTFPIGILPHNVQISSDGKRILAVGSLPGTGAMKEMGNESKAAAQSQPAPATMTSASPGQLIVLDATAGDAAVSVRIPVGQEPAHVITDAQGGTAYVTSAEQNAVDIIDLAKGRVVARIATAKMPHGLRASPDGREIYVAGTGGDAVSVLDPIGRKELARVAVGRAPVQVAFLPAGDRVYVSLRDDNAVAVIDTRTRRVQSTVPVGISPIQLFATPDGRFVYVANQGTEAAPDNTVSIIDTRTDKVVKTLTTANGAHGVVVSRDGNRVFIANTFANSMSVIDTKTQQVIGTIPVGLAPGGITYLAPIP
jgi:YVTN family beta-propeller protein